MAASRGVFEVYSAELAPADITARASEIRFFLADDNADDDEFRVEVPERYYEGFDFGRISVPAAFASLSPGRRIRASLDVIHAGVSALGALRGWEQAALDAVRVRVLARGLRFVWESKWKASRDRRHQARAVYWINDDGHGLVQLEIRQAQSHIVARSAPVLAFMTVEGFKRSAATLRWQGTAAATVVPWTGLFGDYAGLVELSTESGIEAPGWLQPVVAGGPPVKVTAAVQKDQDVAPHPWLHLEVLMTLGTGAYGAEVERVAGLLARDASFEAWWSSTPFDTLRLHVSVPDPRWPEDGFKPGLRKSGMDLVLKIAKTRSELPARTEQPALRETARADIYEALVATARARGFAPPPPLPVRVGVNRKQWHAARD